MSTEARKDNGEENLVTDAGSSTDQHITGYPETGTFTTDLEPRGDTPIEGSGNAGVDNADPDRLEVDDTGDRSAS